MLKWYDLYALDRHAWEEVTQIETRLPASFPWDERFTQFDALAYFSHTIGHARSGDPRAAREALVQLQSAIVGTETPGTVPYLIWDGQALRWLPKPGCRTLKANLSGLS